MNIFVFDEDIKKNAEYHCDKYVVKMILEQTILLNSVYWYTNQEELAIYSTHTKNLPLAKWIAESLSNWRWVRDSTLAIYDEYQYRYNGKLHRAGEVAKQLVEPNLKDIGLTKFNMTMPEHYICDNPIEAYRNYFYNDKKHIFEWTGRKVPEWIEKRLEEDSKKIRSHGRRVSKKRVYKNKS